MLAVSSSPTRPSLRSATSNPASVCSSTLMSRSVTCGIALEKARHQRRDEQPAVALVDHDAQRGALGDRLQRGACRLDFERDALAVPEDRSARRRQRDAPRGALEQAQPELPLQLRHRAADAHLGHLQAPGGGGESVQLHHAREDRHLIGNHGRHLDWFMVGPMVASISHIVPRRSELVPLPGNGGSRTIAAMAEHNPSLKRYRIPEPRRIESSWGRELPRALQVSNCMRARFTTRPAIRCGCPRASSGPTNTR